MAVVAQIPDLKEQPEPRQGKARSNNVYLISGSGIIKSPNSWVAGSFRTAEALLEQNGMKSFLRLIRRKTDISKMIAQEVRPEVVDGVIVICYYKEEVAQALYKTGVPSICIDYTPQTVPVDSVTTNNYSAALKVMNHLHELGHTNIDFMGHYYTYPRIDFDSKELEFYWQQKLKVIGGKGKAFYLRRRSNRIQTIIDDITRRDDPPTAVFLSNPTFAGKLYNELKKRDISVCDDISLIAMGGSFNSKMKVTSVEIDWGEIARLAVHHLIGLIDKTSKPGTRLMHAGRLIDRGSVKKIN
jgi:DNA-binding LacI/PurR family transcriptional regulator